MAINRSLKIDDIYRNENGISYQIQSMDSAYKGEKVYVPATKLFKEAVISIVQTERYFKMLEEAKIVITANYNNKKAFLAWAESNFSAQRCKWIAENILKIEQLAVALKLISCSIFEVMDLTILKTIYKVASKNKIFQIKNRKFIKNINEDFKAYMKFCSLKPEMVESAVKLETDTQVGQIIAQPKGRSLVVDFDNEESMAFTKPRSISFYGTELSTPSTWKDAYVSTVAVLYEKHPDVFRSLSSFPGSKRLEFANSSDSYRMTEPRKISNELCVETNFSAINFVKRIKALLSMCGEDYSVLTIAYEKQSRTTTKKNSKHSGYFC